MKKVLILTYYWPPAGGPGVQRVLKFAKYLPQFGWEPVILTVDDGEYSALDESLIKDVPEGLKVYKTKTLEPFSLYKKLTGQKDKAIETYALTETSTSLKSKLFKWIRLNLFIPDARIGWKNYAVRKGLEIIESENIDVILSSSPPHSLQLAASKIAQKTGKPWLADFRDLWLDAFYIPTEEQGARARRKNAILEKNVLLSTDKVISTSQEIVDDFKKKSEDTNYDVVYNGYDSTDFSDVIVNKNSSFVIRYFGSISSGQNPTALFNFLKKIKKESPDIAKSIGVEIFGKIDATVMRDIENYNLGDLVKFKGYVSHSEVPKLMKTSDCLLLLLPRQKYKGMVPGKLFEYMAANQTILALGEVTSEVSRLLKQTNTGEIFAHSEDISDFVLKQFHLWKSAAKPKYDTTSIAPFSRYRQTEKLANILNDLID